MTEPRDLTEEGNGDDAAWAELRDLTSARIGLRRSGSSLATAPMLDFRLAHARARDAVHQPLDRMRLVADLSALGHPVIEMASCAADRHNYLMRPDLGRVLAPELLAALRQQNTGHDVVFVIADGLSARAVQNHAQPVLTRVLSGLSGGLRVGPIVLAHHGRVAIGDAIAATLKADCVAMLIGERPGLTAPDGMGAYLTWQPHTGTTDAERNCISNIRPDGIGYDDAAFKIVRLLSAMRARKLSGIVLKDETERPGIEQG